MDDSTTVAETDELRSKANPMMTTNDLSSSSPANSIISCYDDDYDHSGVFSDCNSDRSGEFSMTSSSSTESRHRRRRFLISLAGASSDEDSSFTNTKSNQQQQQMMMIERLVSTLESSESIDEQKQAAMEIRLLALNKPEHRLRIAQAGAIRPLISLMDSPDPQLQEYGVTAILNLSLCDENRKSIVSLGAIKPLLRALKSGTWTAKENAACTLLRLAQAEENIKAAIGRAGAVPMLVELLDQGSTTRGKKDAATALYSLCSLKENKIRAVQGGVMRPLLELMAEEDLGSSSNNNSMVDKAACVVSVLISVAEARASLVEEGGIPVLVEMVESGTQLQKGIAVAILLALCRCEESNENINNSTSYRTMVSREGAIPPLVALTQDGTARSKDKAETLIKLLRRPRSGNGRSRGSA